MHRKCAILLLIGAINGALAISFESSQRSTTKKLEKDKVLEDLDKPSRDTLKIVESEDDNVRKEKKGRVFFGPLNVDLKGSDCCGSRYGSSFPGRPEGMSFGSAGFSATSEGGRYPSRFGNRPGNRYDWQSPSYPLGLTGSVGRPGSGGLYGESHGEGGLYGEGNRYDSRPNFGSSGRPIGAGAPDRPGGGSFSIGGASGFGGGASDGGGRPSNTFGRPGYVGHGGDGFGRPGGYGGGGGYGISGSFDGGGHFGGEPGDFGFAESGVTHKPGGNINSHKTLALKALAGVALIGAAAALVSNPVLLPIGVVSGKRRKRSNDNFEDGVVESDYRLKMLEIYVSKMTKGNFNDDALTFSKCVAKLACEIQWKYFPDVKNHESVTNRDGNVLYHSFQHHFTELIQSNIVAPDYVKKNLKRLTKLSVSVGFEGEDCNIFVCDVRKSKRFVEPAYVPQ